MLYQPALDPEVIISLLDEKVATGAFDDICP